MGRVWFGPVMGPDAVQLGTTQDGRPVVADSEGIAMMTEITSAFAGIPIIRSPFIRIGRALVVGERAVILGTRDRTEREKARDAYDALLLRTFPPSLLVGCGFDLDEVRL